jgi:Fibronectin type III domain.
MAMVVFVGTTAVAATYYTFTNAAPEATASWWINTNGTGAHPANFTTAGDIFIIQNNNTMTTVAAWTVTGSVVINTGCTLTATAANVTVGALTINSGGILTTSRILTVNGATVITGTLNFTTTARADVFNGNITLNIGAVWNEAIAITPSITGSLINSATTFTASTGLHTFNAAAGGTISGTTATVIPSVTFTTSYTNSGTLTCATVLNVTGAAVVLTNNGTITATTALSSTGGVNNGATGVLNIGGTSGITTLTATTAGNTVNYNGGAAQPTCKVTTYYNLTISGIGAKTFATTPTVNGVLSLEGTANIVATAGVVTYGPNATLQYNKPGAYTATAEEWITPFAATGGVIIANVGAITMGAVKVFNADVPLTVNTGATLTPGANLLTLGGNFTISGTGVLTSGSGGIIITGTATTQNISGFTTTGSVSMTKTAGTATISGAVSAVNLTVNGNGGTLVLSGSNTFTGIRTLTAGTLILGNTAALGAAATALALNGGTLDLMTDASVNAYNITIGGTATISSDRATSGVGITHTLGTLSIGNFTLSTTVGSNVSSGTAGLTFGNTTLSVATPIFDVATGANLTLGALTGNFSFTKQNTGQITLNTASIRSAGVTTLTTGTMVLGSASALGTTATTLTLNGGTLDLAIDASVNAYNTIVGGAVTIASDKATASSAGIIHTLGTLSINASTLTIVGGSNVASGTAGVTFGAVTHTAAPTYTVNNPAGGGVTQLSLGAVTNSTFLTTFNGSGNIIQTGVFGNGSGGITYSGTGILTLNQANTYTGSTTISTGTLKLGASSAVATSGPLGTTGSGTTIASGAVLDLNGFSLTAAATETLTLNGTGIANGGAVINSSVTGATYAGLITLGTASSIVGGTGTINISNAGTITGATLGLTLGGAAGGTLASILGTTSGTLAKVDAGAWTLSGANTFTGGTTLTAGTLNINNANALGTAAGTFTINGGTVDNTSGADITTVSYPLALNNDFTYSGSMPRNLNFGTGTVTLSTNRQITVSAGTLTIGGIINDNSKDLTKAGAGTLSFGASAVTLNGLTISAGTMVSTSGTMNLAGNFSNSGTFTANGGTVNLNGSATQTIGGSSATSFSGLTINNSNGIILGGNTTVAGTLTFTNGSITTNAYSLAVSSTGTVSRTSGYVIGNLNLYFAVGATSHTFDIGDGSAYTPVTVSFASVTTAGSLTATTTNGDHPQILASGLNNSKTANRYWTLTNNGIVFTTYDVVFTFVPADLDGSAVPASFSVGRYNSGTWSTPTLGARNVLSTQALGIAAFGDFQLGNIQSSGVSNYTPTRTTGITYTSIAATGNAVESWRTSNISDNSYYDDNRSYPVPIGFDFWYDGNRYTQFSASTNGFMDFDASNWNGGSGAVQPSNPYGPYSTDFVNPTRSAPSGGVGTVTALAPFYYDLTTWQTTVPLGNSIMYLLTGTAPNRVLTVEWIDMSTWRNQADVLNFQVKLYESTGVIEYYYGIISGSISTTDGFGYVTGINAPSISPNPPTVAQLLCLQTANTNTFSNGQQNQLSTIPQSNTKYTFTPYTPATPTSLSFSNVTSSSMRLSWNDVADNELGYAIYRSNDGGATYTFIRQLAAGSTYSDESGLNANTTYFWKVYAVTEGWLSSPLSGSRATLAAASFISAQTGNWNTGATWVGGVVPSTNADVTIADGHIVTLDVNATLNLLTIGQGSSGTLHIGNDGTARTLIVSGDLTIKNGATLDVNTAFAQTGHVVTLSGNLINNGILNLGPNASSAAGITLNKPAGTLTISGTGTTTNFYTMNVNVGSTSGDILEVTSSNFSSLSAGFLTLTSGTFKLSTGATITPFSGSQAIPSSAGLWINHSSAVVNTTGGDLSVAGILHTTAGTLNIGNAADNRLIYSGGTIIIEGGTINVAGRIERSNLTTIIKFNMSGGVLTVPTVGSTSTTVSPIELTVVGSTFTWSNGSIIVQREGGSGAQDLGYVNTLTNFTVSGGTLQIGNPSTPAAQRMNINSSPYLYNILVNNTNATAILVGNVTILGDMTVTNGALETTLNGLADFNGTIPQNITTSSPIIFNNLTLDNSTGLSLSGSITVTCTLTLTNGALSIGANTLTFQTSNTPIARTSGTITTTTSSNLVFGTSGNTGGAAFSIPAGTFTASPSINNFTMNRTNSLTLNDQMMSLSGILLCNGPLTTNGNLTLLSTAAQTALIDGSSSGQVSGNVTMQRYLPSGFGYKYISSPFQAATVNEFSNDLDLAASFPTFYKYDENRNSSGWVSYTTTTNLLNPMLGYSANFGSSATAKTVDVSGVVNNGILSITLYNNNQPYTVGFNLVGNPYPSPINWDAASGWTKTNIDNALYYFQAGITDQYTGTYSTYINGVSSDGLATNIIPSMQGFFIHVSNGSFPVIGSLGMTNSVRTNDLTHAFLKSMRTGSQPLLRITAGFADDKTPSDPAVIYFDSSATQLFDKNLDALKWMNTDMLVPNLYTMAPDSNRLSISAIPFPVDSIRRIALGIKTAKDGWITFKASDIKLMPPERYIYLVDSVAGINQDLKLNSQYRFFLKAGEYENRFSLAFSLTVLNNIPKEFSLFQNYPNPFNPRTTIKYSIPQASFVTIMVYDILGKEISKLVNEEKLSGSYEVQFDGSKFSSGVYFYRLHAGNIFKTKKLMLLK